MVVSEAKRGIVLAGAEYEIDGGAVMFRGSGVSRESLRFYLLYFDLIDRPHNNFLTVGLSADEEYLNECGVFTSSRVVVENMRDLGLAMLESHQKAFAMKQSIPGQFWSLGHSGATFVSPQENMRDIELLEMSLFDALPSPNDDVPLPEILEFKERRRPELLALRAHLDEIYESVSSTGDVPRAKSAALTRLNSSIVDLQKVVEPSFGYRMLSGMKVQIDPINIGVLAVAGAAAASGLGVPIALGAAVGAAYSTIKFEYAHGKKLDGTPDNLRDFAYLASMKKELR